MPFIVSAFVRVSRSLWPRHLHNSEVLNAGRKKVERSQRCERRPRKDEDNEDDLTGVKGFDPSRLTWREMKDTDAGPFQDLFDSILQKHEAAARKRKREWWLSTRSGFKTS
jgi:hypothetical protein